MERAEYSDENCSIARTLEMVGERWSLLILREAFLGVRRFDQLQANLGIARNILADRLQRLVGAGILQRQLYQERPKRYEYRLTQMGLDLYPALVAMMQWGDRYLADEAGAPVKLEHLECGKETEPLFVCSECGGPIHARNVRPKVGPGALRKTA
jgi:DNA-binding HxlR family transcriptional regulator